MCFPAHMLLPFFARVKYVCRQHQPIAESVGCCATNGLARARKNSTENGPRAHTFDWQPLDYADVCVVLRKSNPIISVFLHLYVLYAI